MDKAEQMFLTVNITVVEIDSSNSTITNTLKALLRSDQCENDSD